MSRKWSKAVHYAAFHSDRAARSEARETQRLRQAAKQRRLLARQFSVKPSRNRSFTAAQGS